MNSIVIAILLLVVAGFIVGVVLTVASVIMAVPVDPKEEEIIKVLPGANCGACGFSGCQGYASALACGETANCSLCAPGGKDVMEKVSAILGLNPELGNLQFTAVVKCRGTCENTSSRVKYEGVKSCQMASQVLGGPQKCSEGCLGYGDCMRACPFDAINLIDGVAVVDPRKCKACKLCVAVCPKKIISLVPLSKKNAVNLCSNHEKGGIAKKNCSAACIGCSICAKKCPKGCITVENNNATVDFNSCVGCNLCVKNCPTTAMQMLPIKTVDLSLEIESVQKKVS